MRQTNQYCWIALIDALREGVKRIIGGVSAASSDEPLGMVWCGLSDFVAHLHPVRRILLHAADQRGARPSRVSPTADRQTRRAVWPATLTADGERSSLRPYRVTFELLGQELQAEGKLRSDSTAASSSIAQPAAGGVFKQDSLCTTGSRYPDQHIRRALVR